MAVTLTFSTLKSGFLWAFFSAVIIQINMYAGNSSSVPSLFTVLLQNHTTPELIRHQVFQIPENYVANSIVYVRVMSLFVSSLVLAKFFSFSRHFRIECFLHYVYTFPCSSRQTTLIQPNKRTYVLTTIIVLALSNYYHFYYCITHNIF